MADGLFGLLSGFDALAGIGEAREVQVRDKSVLERLLEAETKLIHGETQGWYNDVFVQRGRFCGGYDFLYKRLTELLINVNFTKEDLSEFILAKANNDYQPDYSAALGLFTGCLLEILTERNTKEGKRTIVYINGAGNRFDYLFSHARAADTLVVDNFRGDYICHKIRNPSEKTARNVAVLNTSRYRICTGINGNIWNLFIINCYGNYIASEVSKDSNLSEDSKQAAVSNLYIINAIGDYTVHNLADNGKVNDVFIVNENGNVNIGDISARNGRINTLYIISRGGVINFIRPSLADVLGTIETLPIASINAQELYRYDGRLYVNRAVLEQYRVRMQVTAADEKISLLKSLKGKSYSNIMKILEIHF